MSGKFEIFISYRRKGGHDTAKLLYDKLKMDGYSVSFDIETLEKGYFDKELEHRVSKCKDFLLILSPGAFDRLFESGYDSSEDWVYQEIASAFRTNRNIVPLILDGFAFPKGLPSDIKDIARKNAIDLNPKYFEDAYARMKRHFLVSKPHWAIRHKKLIISLLFVMLLMVGVGVYFAIATMSKKMDSELQEAKIAIQQEAARADSIANYMDSIDSIRTERAKRRQATAPAAPVTSVKLAAKKSLHWRAPNDAIGQVVFDKISSAGIAKTECSGDGIVVNLNRAECKNNDSEFTCSYSPRITLTHCNGKLHSLINSEAVFATSPQASIDAAKEELAKELRTVNFSDWVSALKEL